MKCSIASWFLIFRHNLPREQEIGSCNCSASTLFPAGMFSTWVTSKLSHPPGSNSPASPPLHSFSTHWTQTSSSSHPFVELLEHSCLITLTVHILSLTKPGFSNSSLLLTARSVSNGPVLHTLHLYQSATGEHGITPHASRAQSTSVFTHLTFFFFAIVNHAILYDITSETGIRWEQQNVVESVYLGRKNPPFCESAPWQISPSHILSTSQEFLLKLITFPNDTNQKLSSKSFTTSVSIKVFF